MNDELQDLFNDLIQLEHVSSTLYLAMSAYMAKQIYRYSALVKVAIRGRENPYAYFN